MKNWREWKINTIEKSDFPKQLKEIKKCPEKLFYRGNWDNNVFKKSLSIVGSRRMSRYGQEVIAKFMPVFVANNITIISGFMYGVDAESHKKCLEFGGKTIAVLGGGLNILTPPENDNLYSEILENNGLVISEYTPNFQPTLWSFPQRNRIVSGLSTLGVLVIEAGIKSGSLITARIGREQGKKIYAVPGQINNSIAEGTNYLIKSKQGKITTKAQDIVGNMDNLTQGVLFESSDPLENSIIELLKIEAKSVDELCNELKIETSELTSKISMMCLEGKISEDNGRIYLYI